MLKVGLSEYLKAPNCSRGILVLTAHLIAAQETNREVTFENLEDGPGLLPFRLGSTRLITHYHTFIQYTKLRDIADKIELSQNQINEFKHRLSNDTFILFELQIEYLSRELSKVLDHLETLQPNRVKRGLIDGLGSLIKSVTGNLDQSDAIKYNNAIKILQGNENKFIHEVNDHISLSKEWMAQHTDIVSKLIENQSKINETLLLLLNRETYPDYSLIKYAKFAQYLTIMTENTNEISQELIRIEDMLAFIRSAVTHHSIIKYKVLKHMLDRLVSIYGKEHILNLEIREYYDLIKPGFFYVGNQIVITLKIPVFSSDNYDLYKLSIAPNKLGQALIPPYPLIATNRKGYVYIEAECPKFNNWYLCGGTMDHQIRDHPDCIQNLITDQIVDSTCEISKVTLSRMAMEELDEKHYVISFPNSSRIHTVCDREDYNILNGTYLVTIPSNCFLSTSEFTITNSNDQVEGRALKITKLHYNDKTQRENSFRLSLNSIDLRRLHDVQHQLMLQPTLQTIQVPSDYLYHTTIPIYGIIVIVLIGVTTWTIRRYFRSQHKSKISPTEDTYAMPGRVEAEKPKSAIFLHLKNQK